MIIDVHTHLNDYGEGEPPTLGERLNLLQRQMSDNGVDYALVLSSYQVNERRPSTRELVEATRDADNLFIVAGLSMREYRERDLRELSDLLQDGLVKGLKIYPGYEPLYPYDNRCQVIYDLASEHDVPVMIHTGDTFSRKGKLRFAHPLNVDDVAVDNPQVKLVICHVGNPWIQDCMEVVYKNENVYADLSGLVLGDFKDQFEEVMLQQVHHLITYMGAPRWLLYGTDWPLCSMESYLKFMHDLQLSDEGWEMVMWRNTAELFKLGVAAPATRRRSQPVFHAPEHLPVASETSR